MTDTLKYDSPLNDPVHDILGRKKFSEMLAQSIIKLKASQGFVYGLYGPWGSGKSTVINFTERYIEKHNQDAGDKGKIVIFKFNPWMFSSSENLTKVYLDQLRVRLGMEDVSENLKGLSKKFEVIEKSLSFASPIINFVLPGVGSAVNSASQSLSSAREISNSSSDLTKKDLFHIKEEITKTLESQNDKILVIIDDLDRLFDDEIRDFVKMIKAVCDFPKIIYLIACDDEKVASALSRHTEGNSDGYDYLEKIVQCSFSIPNPSSQSLHGMFFKDLDQIFDPIEHKELLFDETDWVNLFFDAVAPCLKTPRNVKVLINSMAAYYPPVKDEVNIVDFVGVQVLRVFYPQAYTAIQDKANLLAGSTDDRDDRKAFYQELERQVPKNDVENFKKLMSRLFPRYAQLMSSGLGYDSQWNNTWIKQRKVCSKEYFSLYFTLDIPEDGISLSEMMAIISLADNPEKIKTKLRSFIEEDKKSHKKTYKTFLNELECFTEDVFPKEKIQPFLQVMYDLSDEVPPNDRYGGLLDMGIDMLTLRISYQLIKRFDFEEERFQILQSIFQNSASLSLVVRKTSLIDSKKEKENIVNSQQAAQLITIALERIKEWVKAGKLCMLDNLGYVMFRWKELSSESEVKKYASDLITSDNGLIVLLTGFLNTSTSYSMGDSVARKAYRVPRKYIQDFIEELQFATLVDRARKILLNNKEMHDRQKIALTAFLDEIDNPDKYVDLSTI